MLFPILELLDRVPPRTTGQSSTSNLYLVVALEAKMKSARLFFVIVLLMVPG